MKLKWYICTLIIVLTFLGVGQHQISTPNQEIVFHFGENISTDETQKAITLVKRQLQNLGADNLIVSDDGEGKLIISYFSKLDVSNIRNILSEGNQLSLGIVEKKQKKDSKLPLNENQKKYSFDVYEIQKEFDSDWDFNGTKILELNPEANRFSNPKVYVVKNKIDFHEVNSKVTLKIHYGIAIAINETSYKIPEVRAGPSV